MIFVGGGNSNLSWEYFFTNNTLVETPAQLLTGRMYHNAIYIANYNFPNKPNSCNGVY
jgi:hypothetical protein